jgi:hypothetical protein
VTGRAVAHAKESGLGVASVSAMPGLPAAGARLPFCASPRKLAWREITRPGAIRSPSPETSLRASPSPMSPRLPH